MTNYYCISTSSGNSWVNGAYWSLTDGGGAAGDWPKSGDTAYIKTGKAIAIASTVPIYKILQQGGYIKHNSGRQITFDDTAGAGLFIDSTNAGGYQSFGTISSRAYMASASTVPANPFTVSVDAVAGADLRTLIFGYCTMRGIAPTLGISSSARIVFNQPGGTAWLNNVPPLFRDQMIVEHPIDGRAYSRIYPRGGKAGVITVTGFLEWSSYYHEYLQELLDSRSRMYLFSPWVQLPRCRATGRVSAPTRPGQTIVPFSLTLIEDR